MRLSSWYFISIMVSYMSLFFSTSIILDLYYVLKNPFSSSEKRMKKFVFIAVVVSLICAAAGLRLTLSQVRFWSSMNLILFIFVGLSNLFLGILTMIFVLLRFRTKGMSAEIKSSI